MKKGFTLAELVGVIVILTLVMLLAFPAITKLLKKNRIEVSESTLLLFKIQAELYLSDRGSELTTKNGSVYCITLQQLVDGNYLKEPVIDAETSNEYDLTLYTKMSYSNTTQWSIEVTDTCEPYTP